MPRGIPDRGRETDAVSRCQRPWPRIRCHHVLAGGGRDGMVDIPDLKSEGRMPVGVRVPPPAPPPFTDYRFDLRLPLAAVGG